ncbi:hypothetical protein Tco_1070346 [Tanacetum coccineum]|uniref:Uncharacterized protein n=1 Tax=Tanacetum coccineum TaxID=301880 RepID=A0ABQ5HLF3_9ASTR
MTTLADKSLLSGGDNKPPMLEKHLYDSWKSRMELYMMNRPHGRMILASVEKGPLVWPSITEDGVTRLKEYVELTPAEAIQADCDIKAINIILQGLPTEIYALGEQTLAGWNNKKIHTLVQVEATRGNNRLLLLQIAKGGGGSSGEGHMLGGILEGLIAKECTKAKREKGDMKPMGSTNMYFIMWVFFAGSSYLEADCSFWRICPGMAQMHPLRKTKLLVIAISFLILSTLTEAQ